MAPKPQSKLLSRPQRVIYLVRHGQFKIDDHPADGLEGGLTTLGRQQARRTAQRLRRLPIHTIYHSDLRRAAETAAIIARAIPSAPVRASSLLRECTPVIPTAFLERFAAYPPEEFEADRVQAEAAFDRFFQPLRRGVRHEVVVCHGNLIRYFVCRLLHVNPAAWGYMDVRQCSITEVVLHPAWSRVVALGDVGHLPFNLWTYL